MSLLYNTFNVNENVNEVEILFDVLIFSILFWFLVLHYFDCCCCFDAGDGDGFGGGDGDGVGG